MIANAVHVVLARVPQAVARLWDAAKAAVGRVDVLVNNAGVMQLAPMAEADDALVDRQIAINLKGQINTMHLAARRLRDGGRIINLSSSVVGLYQPTYGSMPRRRAGIEALTHVLSTELRGRSITVNAVAPGPTATALFLDGKPQAVIDQLAKLAPLERLGQPEDIANTVAFLAGPDGAWISTVRSCAPTAGSSDRHLELASMSAVTRTGSKGTKSCGNRKRSRVSSPFSLRKWELH